MNHFLTYRDTTLKVDNLKRVEISKSVSEESDKVVWWELMLMFFLLAISGNPYIGIKQFELFTVASVLITVAHILRNYKKSVSYRTIIIFVFLLGYEIMHAILFKLDYTFTFFKLAIILLLSTASVDILKHKFIDVLTKTMVLISLVSFVFVLISYTPLHSPLYRLADKLLPLNDYNGYHTPTVIIYTFCYEYFVGQLPYVRNAGIFWESGAFAVFLNITLFLHYSTKSIKSVKDLFNKESTILIIALASTTSTMGALSLMIILSFFSAQLKSALKYALLIIIIFSAYLAFTTVDFLGEKINRELNQSKVTNNRFGSALKDFENIAERPLLGWSRRIEVVFNTTVYSAKTHRPNGFTNFLRNYGLVYFSFYFALVFYSFKNIYIYHNHSYNAYVPMFGVFLLCLISFSEVIFDLAFLKSLMFLSTAYIPLKDKLGKEPFKNPFQLNPTSRPL